MTNKDEERVLVAARAEVFRHLEPFQGLATDAATVHAILKQYAMYHRFARRGDVEEDATLKQLIPYGVIRQGWKVLVYRRLEGGGEARLHGKYSAGFGGHMNDVRHENGNTMRLKDQIAENLWRELDEELSIPADRDDVPLEVIGVINDEAEEAGVYHLGIAFVVNVPEGVPVTVRETDAHAGEWVGLDDLSARRESFEGWSRLLIDHLSGAPA